MLTNQQNISDKWNISQVLKQSAVIKKYGKETNIENKIFS